MQRRASGAISLRPADGGSGSEPERMASMVQD
jgi:hypothetical protein